MYSTVVAHHTKRLCWYRLSHMLKLLVFIFVYTISCSSPFMATCLCRATFDGSVSEAFFRNCTKKVHETGRRRFVEMAQKQSYKDRLRRCFSKLHKHETLDGSVSEAFFRKCTQLNVVKKDRFRRRFFLENSHRKKRDRRSCPRSVIVNRRKTHTILNRNCTRLGAVALLFHKRKKKEHDL